MRQASSKSRTERLYARIEDLELRLKLLEARMRAVTAWQKDQPKLTKTKRTRPGKPRPRCPGCVLELPPGRRGDSCVWCGFRFDALGRALK
jgi:hypothetical protein